MNVRALKNFGKHKKKGDVWIVSDQVASVLIAKGIAEDVDNPTKKPTAKKTEKKKISNKLEKKKPANK